MFKVFSNITLLFVRIAEIHEDIRELMRRQATINGGFILLEERLEELENDIKTTDDKFDKIAVERLLKLERLEKRIEDLLCNQPYNKTNYTNH